MGEGTGPTIFLSAAEASGDLHAANLIRALSQRLPGAQFVGVGGPRMAQAGCEIVQDPTGQASMLLGPLGKLSYYRRLISTAAEAMDRHSPSVLVPVDSPALNWHLARLARDRGIPVMYYIAPQVWAWAPWRVKKLRRLTDRVACVLPFEEEYFRRRGVQASFVGHPMLDHLPSQRPSRPPPPSDEAWRIALLPGSRPAEVRGHAPAMAQAATIIRRRFPRATFSFSVETQAAAELITASAGSELPIVTGQTQRVMAESHFALCKSGTVTLEAAWFGLPMVVVYRASRVLYGLLRWWLFRTRYLSLVNILSERELVPELMPWGGHPAELARVAIAQLENPPALEATSRELVALAETLRPPGGVSPSAAAAEMVVQTMEHP